MDTRWKRMIETCGILLILPGLGFGFFGVIGMAVIVVALAYRNDSSAALYNIAILTAIALTFGAGVVTTWHAQKSLKGKPSGALRLPPLVVMLGSFVVLILIGLAMIDRKFLPALFLPPIFLMLVALPPLWAVSWFTPRKTPGETDHISAPASQLSWRRGLVAFCGGATVSVFLALVLEISISATVLSLISNAAQTVLNGFSGLFSGISGSASFARALTDPFFIYFFVEVTVIAPLVEELVKPLVTLPLLRQLNRQETFWVGALAGAGFATIENILYAGGGFSIWAGILLVRALGGALHPLGSGLVALGWRDVLLGKPKAFENWFKQYGLAVLIHALWNGGSLLVITLGSAGIFGVLPASIDILGLSMAGTTFVFLLLLGIAALWLGRAYGHNRTLQVVPETEGDSASDAGYTLSERATALWALACLLALVPIGIAGLRLWLR